MAEQGPLDFLSTSDAREIEAAAREAGTDAVSMAGALLESYLRQIRRIGLRPAEILRRAHGRR